MNIIIIGLGQVGTHIADVLFREKHNITLIDNNQSSLDTAGDSIDALTINGNGASAQVLVVAEVSNCDLVIAVSSNDEVNLLAAATAKQFGAKRAIARVSGFDIWQSSQPVSRGLLEIDLILNIKVIGALEIVRLIRSMEAMLVEEYAGNEIEAAQFPVSESSKILGVPLKDVNIPGKSVIATIIRDGTLIIPGGDDVINSKDEIIVIGSAETIPELEKLIGGNDQIRRAHKVAIMGGGEIGFWVAKALLAKRLEVLIIELNREKCVELSEKLDKATIINGDGTSSELLKEERIETYDVFITLSNDDELNLMSALLARELGVKKTIALVNKSDYAPVYEQLGVNATISPRLLAAKQILKYTREGALRSVSPIMGGQGEVIEIETAEDSKITKKPLDKVNFPKGAVIGSVSGPNGVYVPRGDDTIEAGSTVVIFLLPKVRSKVVKLFR
ncbi:MAG: Trk system potassium transporter TrkA [candidate division Zixibacteria bacterium]|nr:Trk system potassium transporter TrkA [candidate division Zixibacteria bacterium]